MDDIKATVIIPNYNGLRFMEPCMSALKKQTYTAFCILIIDNGSADGSVQYLKELESAWPDDAPALSVIFLPENTGFSGAVNTGIKAARTDYIVLLNNDTEAAPDYLEKLLEPFCSPGGERLAAVSPKMVQLYNKELLDDAGDGYNILGWAFQRGVGQPVTEKKFSRKTHIFSACAGAAAYRRTALEEIRFRNDPLVTDACFDPLHFAYLEDLDVSFRLRIRGYSILYAPESIVYHVGSGTSGSKYNAFKVRLAARNNIYLNYKNMPALMLLINLPFILLGVLVKLIFFTRLGLGDAYKEGFKEGICGIKACRAHKTFFIPSRLPVYIKLEVMMAADTFSYIQDFAVRRLQKAAHKAV